ncbi:unnamed protein product [Phytophthora fragariaefolia]|uniref:Unnamed protein product n=1 Tax=Phytophthora fragariaefolia TaxID=1490495 RepID=A0A9W6XLL0_9STRA|nr:unnamed protein product [Phytophthora fragariaefolia]
MWMLEQSVIGPLGTVTRLPFVATAKITAQLAEMIDASANAPTTEITETAEMTTVRGVPMIAENDAVTRPSYPAMVLVQHAEAAGTQHTSAIGGANSASRCMMRDSAEPAVEANHVFAFVGMAHLPEMWCVRSDALECEYDGRNELGDPEEDRRAVAGMTTGTRRVAERHSKMTKLSPGKRMGWWSAQKFDRRVRMRALVLGTVNDVRTKVLLDTGENVSAVSESFARRLHLKRRTNSDRQIDIQGIGKGKVLTSSRATVKVTLGWQVVYEFEAWIMPHHAGVDLILGTDFMIPAGIRLALYNSTARLPDEVKIPLIKSRSAWLTEPTYGDRVSDGPAESLSIPVRMIADFTLRRKQPSEDTHEFCVRRTKDWIPTVAHSSRGKPTRVLQTNVSGKPVWCPAHFPVILWAPHGELPPDDGYVRLNSAKYSERQVLAYEAAMDKDLLKREQQLYADWLASQPPAVERRQYAVSKDVMKRGPRRVDNGEAELTCALQHELLERAAKASAESASDRTEAAVTPTKPARDGLHKSETTESTADDSVHYEPAESAGDDPASSVQAVATSERTDCDVAEPATAAPTDAAEWNDGPNAGAAHQSRLGVTILEAKSPDQAAEREHLSRVDFARHETAELSADSEEGSSVGEAIASLLSDEIEVSDVALADDPDRAVFECSANEIDLEDYAHELAFLPDLTDSASTVLDYGGSNVVCSAHTPSQREKLVKALKAQQGIMIASGNALPPPAYGAICDIDVQGHKPIKQRARRVPLKHLKKLYELLKDLHKAGLIAFSNSPWASPIVIVLKKNGVDIRLCIDYKMVNAIAVLMEYAKPLVDDLLTELESYLWFSSLDAASGFWAVMMTQRAREISAFVCALGHFEWLRMPIGLKNAPMIYQRIIDNALWGYVQPRGGWASYADKVRRAEAASATQRGRLSDPNQPTPDAVNSATKFEADHRALAESDPLQDLVNSPESDMFANGEPDESTLTPVFDRRSFVDDICFGGTTFEDCLATLSRLLARFAEYRISICFTKSIFVQPTVDFLSHEVSQHGIRANRLS